MGESTRIEWTDATWNPFIGCRRVSPGCAHCYADTLVTNRLRRDFKTVTRSAPATFNAPLRWARGAPPRDDGGRIRYVFTCSLSDFFIEDADPWREEAWRIIRATPGLTYQILTKRPENVFDCLPDYWDEVRSHVWLGVSVEKQQYLERLYQLMEYFGAAGDDPAVYFVSAEPLLGPVRLDPEWGTPGWVIAGGESGEGARPAKEEWFRSLLFDCLRFNVPYFLKQLGGHPDSRSHEKATLDGRRWTQMPEQAKLVKPAGE